MKIGNLVRYHPFDEPNVGIIVGFNEKGNGGDHYVHVLKKDGTIQVFGRWDIEVVTND